MAQPVPYQMSIFTSSVNQGEVTIENVSTKNSLNEGNNIIRVNTGSSRRVSINLQNMKTAINEGDLIEIRSAGVRSENLVHTIKRSRGRAEIKLNNSPNKTTVDYAGASVTL